ncbi:S-adenosyl-L-methionine-dependent methyltransferase [Ascobolus immersus RN42]|uniref:S-adenosyl-L-methionine-dependent methyltransferase n=1 Tax=Ascobolus immersus RN42 TaxID=1160509 RepID=A0A3N4INU6_ASCIM|nr:S-adenosyl-L-methionine-dependent methyltransferase [Ascobolus immersus RN42]
MTTAALHHPTPLTTDPIEVATDDDDSCYGDSLASSTTSITSSITSYVFSHGRRYPSQRWSSASSLGAILPNDETEQDRLDLIHHLYLLILKGSLYLAPLKPGSVHRALDLGTGTGIWAVDFADLHPEAAVIGTDLSPIQSSWVPPNLQFEVDNFEEEWGFSGRFDYIHGRSLMGSVTDWPKLVGQAYENLNPGGFFELLEIHNTGSYSSDGTYEASACAEYSKALEEAGRISGHRLDLTPALEGYFRDAGFVNVTVKKFVIPCGVWPKDAHYKRIGAIVASQVADAVEGYGLVLLTKVLGWEEDKARDLIRRAAEAYKDRKVHTLNDQYVVYGQKPLEE